MDVLTELSATAGAIESLAPALFQTFCTIGLGYVLTRFGIIPAQGARAMALYVSMIAYPARVFYQLANLNFATVIWPIFWATFVSRAIIFVVAIVFELVWRGVTPDSIANAGIFGIFTSQSNDLPLGIPIITAVFPHFPAYTSMVYLITLTRVMLNPFAFYMMIYGRMKKLEAREKEDPRQRIRPVGASGGLGSNTSRSGLTDDEDEEGESTPRHATLAPVPEPVTKPGDHTGNLRHVLQRVFINPLVLSSVFGVICNKIFGGKIPGLFDPFIQKLGDSFSACALFVLGVAMHGQLDRLNDRRQLKTPLWLFVAKSILLPVISRFVAGTVFGLDSNLVLFAFILGTLPSSENVPFFAYDYQVPAQHMIAPAMVLGTFLAAPVMFVAAQMVNITLTQTAVDHILIGTMRVFSTFAIAAGLYFLYILYYNKRWTTVRDKLLIGLIIIQLTHNFSAEFCGDNYSTTAEGVRFAFVFTARLASRFWILSMVLYEVIHYFYPDQQTRSYKYFVMGSITLSIFIMLLTAFGGVRTPAELSYAECFLRYGKFQWTLMVIIDAVSLVILCYAWWKVGKRQRLPRLRTSPGADYKEVKVDSEDEEEEEKKQQQQPSTTTNIIVDEATAHPIASPRSPLSPQDDQFTDDQVGSTANVPPSNLDFYSQTPRVHTTPRVRPSPTAALLHTARAREEESSWAFGMFIFMILSILWMMINLALSLWSATSNLLVEGRMELFLLDGVLSGGQGIWTWLIFGLAGHVKSPLRFVTRWVREKADIVVNWQSS